MPPAGRRRTPIRRRRGTRRRLGAALVVLLLATAWVGWRVWQGTGDLRTAAEQLRAVRSDLGQTDRAVSSLRLAGERTASARRHLSDPLVRAAATVPVVGDPLRTAAGLATAADTTVRGALLPLVGAAGPDPAARLTDGPGAVDVDWVAALAPEALQAQAALARAAAAVEATPARTRVAAVDEARAAFSTDLTALRATVDDVALVVSVAPQLLGQEKAQRYLVLSQSPAEARGTGGLIGGYTVLEVTDGVVEVVRSGSKRDLQSPGTSVVDLGVQFDNHYGVYGATKGWINSNLSPHFPYAAQIAAALWQRQTGEQLDGVLALDPIALSYLLRATGPVTLPDGTAVRAEDVADLTLREVYERFPGTTLADDERRDALLQPISTSVAAAVASGDVDGRALVTALAEAAQERRLLFWSADGSVQERLLGQPISGALPQGRPAVGDVVVDAAGSKLDYYLARDLRYTPGCGKGPSQLALALTNTAPPSGLPAYVTPEGFRRGGPPGTNVLIATLYVPPGSAITGVTLDGEEVYYRQGTELGLEWVEVLVTLRPGQRSAVTATFDELPRESTEVVRIAQPLVLEETFTATGC